MTTSPYKIWWAQITPKTGRCVTKHDQRIIDDCCLKPISRQTVMFVHLGSADDVAAFKTRDWSKLQNTYECIIFTDAQFRVAEWSATTNQLEVRFTRQQRDQKFTI